MVANVGDETRSRPRRHSRLAHGWISPISRIAGIELPDWRKRQRVCLARCRVEGFEKREPLECYDIETT